MSAETAVSHYEVLGVPEHADAQEITAAYRAGLAKIKADIATGTPLLPDSIDRLREAYGVLGDAEKKRAYDQSRKPPSVDDVFSSDESISEPSSRSEETNSHFKPAGGSMLVEASKSLKWLYCLTLVATIFPTAFVGASNWISLVTGGGLFSFGIFSFLVWSVASIYRIVLVVKYPTTLSAYPDAVLAQALRKIGIFLMIAGLLGAIVQLFAGHVAMAVFAKSGGKGIALFVVRMYSYFISSGGLLGLLLFELSRLLGFEAKLRTSS